MMVEAANARSPERPDARPVVDSTLDLMSSDRRDKWYRAGWYSERTCLDAFEAGATAHGDVRLTFVVGDSVRGPTVREIHDEALALAASCSGSGCAAATPSRCS